MGTIAFSLGDLVNVRHYLEHIVHIHCQIKCKPDFDFLIVLSMIENAFKIQADDEKAKEFWLEARQIFKDLGLKEDSPQVAQATEKFLSGENLLSQIHDVLPRIWCFQKKGEKD